MFTKHIKDHEIPHNTVEGSIIHNEKVTTDEFTLGTSATRLEGKSGWETRLDAFPKAWVYTNKNYEK